MPTGHLSPPDLPRGLSPLVLRLDAPDRLPQLRQPLPVLLRRQGVRGDQALGVFEGVLLRGRQVVLAPVPQLQEVLVRDLARPHPEQEVPELLLVLAGLAVVDRQGAVPVRLEPAVPPLQGEGRRFQVVGGVELRLVPDRRDLAVVADLDHVVAAEGQVLLPAGLPEAAVQRAEVPPPQHRHLVEHHHLAVPELVLEGGQGLAGELFEGALLEGNRDLRDGVHGGPADVVGGRAGGRHHDHVAREGALPHAVQDVALADSAAATDYGQEATNMPNIA